MDITQRLRAEYILDTSRVEAANERVRAGFERTEAAAQRLREEFEQIERTGAVPSSYDTSTAATIAQMERDLATPFARPTGANSPQFVRETMGLQRKWAARDIERIESMVDPMVDELYLMESAFGAVTKADREAERQASKSQRTWLNSVNSVARFGSRMGEVLSGLGWFGGAVYGVVAGIEAISNAFSRSDEIAQGYAAAVQGLTETLQEFERKDRDFWKDRRRFVLPGQERRDALRQQLEEIEGTPDSPGAPGEIGNFQKLDEKLTAVRTFILDRESIARDAGLVGPDGRVQLSSSRDIAAVRMGQAEMIRMTDGVEAMDRAIASAKIMDDVFMDGETRIGNYQDALRQAGNLEVQIQKLQEQSARLRQDLETEFLRGLETMASGAKDAFVRIGDAVVGIGEKVVSGFSRLGAGLSGLGDPGTWLGIARTEEQRKTDTKDLLRFLVTGKLSKTTIDARGSKITVNTQVETDDPSRFADVSIKSAFVAVAARPLSATLAFGGPMVGGSKR